MNYRILSLLLICISFTDTYAQSNFKKGYIISLQGDTLQGFINYKEWTRTPAQFLFKASSGDASGRSYTVQNAQKVSIEGYESYERFAVSVSMNVMDYTRLDPSVNPTDKTDTVFLKLITRGDRINLYAYRDEIKERFYVLVPPQTTPQELSFKEEMREGQLATLYTYRQQLKRIASDLSVYTAELMRLIEETSYSKTGLKKVVSQINSVNETESDFNVKKYKRGRFFASAGINYSHIIYEGQNLINANGLDKDGNPAYKNSTTTQSYLPVISAGYDLFFHPAIQRSYLRTELAATATQSKVTSLYKFPRPNDEELTNEYRLLGVFLSLNPQLVYNIYQQHTFKVYIGAGVSLRYSFYPVQTFHQHTNKQGPGYSDKEVKAYFKMKDMTVLPTIHAGAILNRKVSIFVTAYFIPSQLVENYDISKYSSVKESSIRVSAAYFF